MSGEVGVQAARCGIHTCVRQPYSPPVPMRTIDHRGGVHPLRDGILEDVYTEKRLPISSLARWGPTERGTRAGDQ